MICAICLNSIDEPNKVTLACGHSFDNKCLINWLLTKNTCPTCRYQINPGDSDVCFEEDVDDNYPMYLYDKNIFNYSIEQSVCKFADECLENKNADIWESNPIVSNGNYIFGYTECKIKNVTHRLHVIVNKYDNNTIHTDKFYTIDCIYIELLFSMITIQKQIQNVNKRFSNKKWDPAIFRSNMIASL